MSDQSTTEDTVSQQMKEQQNIYYDGSEVTISAMREYQHAPPLLLTVAGKILLERSKDIRH